MKYGCWAKNPIPLSQYAPPLAQFIDLVTEDLVGNDQLVAVDIGCGNGTGMITGFIEVAKRAQCLDIILVDIQPNALEAVRRLYSRVYPKIPQIKPVFIQEDISDDNARETVMSGMGGQLANILVCDSVLHFLDVNKLQQATQTIQSLLKTGGYGYLSVCSIYNPASVGGRGSTQALDIVHSATANGKADRPVSFFQTEMGVVMTFFTEASFRKTLEDSGLEVVRFEGIYNQRLRNGLGDQYPENYGAVVRKRV